MSLGTRVAAELRGDRTIWMVVVMLSLFSILAVYSAASGATYLGDTTMTLMRHLLMIGLGMTMIYLCHLVHYSRYSIMAPYALLISIPLLFLTLAIGTSINDAARWLTIPGLGVSFQTSEFAKIALIIYIARELTKKQDYINSFQEAFMPIIIPVVMVCGLIAPANLSTALILFATCLMLMFIGRVNAKYIFLLMLAGIVVFAGLIVVGELDPSIVRVDTWISRMDTFMNDTDGGFQVKQAKYAISRGGLIGVGPGNSALRYFLPYAHADFIYAIICEEWGLIGGTIVLCLFMLLFFRTVSLVTKSPKAFGSFLAIGLSLSLVIQALANMAVAVHLVPVTGQNLPLISMGGTNMLFTSISLGMILSVSKFVESE